MDLRIDNVERLLRQGRLIEAENAIKGLLAEKPEDPQLHVLYGLIFNDQKKFAEAKMEVQFALNFDPSNPHVHYIHSIILLNSKQFDQSKKGIEYAISVVPDEPDYHVQYGNIAYVEKKMERALAAANKALELQPEHLEALNLRSRALFKLGRKEEAEETIINALGENPENSETHANYGWTALENNDVEKAKEHFRFALSLDPTDEWAQAGLVETLKAKNFLYRLFLRYAFWASNLKDNQMWYLVIGSYVAYRVVLFGYLNSPEYNFIWIPLMAIYLIFVFTTWTINSITNLFLYMSKDGQLLLNDREKFGAKLVGCCISLAIILGISFFIFQQPILVHFVIYFLCMCIPIGFAFDVPDYIDNRRLVMFTIFLSVVGLVGILGPGEGLAAIGKGVFFISIFLFGWIANYLSINRY